MAQRRFLITWVGSFTNRVIKGINNVSPDFVYFLIESRSPQWLTFQKECLDKITRHYGPAFVEGKRFEVVEFLFGAGDEALGISENDFCRKVFSKLFDVVSKIREKAPESEITIDITAAPRMIAFIIAFVAMVLSTKESRVKLQVVPKGFQADPKYYAPEDSSYFKSLREKQDDASVLSLAGFRGIEGDDEGGNPITIELPMVGVDLLFSRLKKPEKVEAHIARTNAEIVLFQKIPAREAKMKQSTVMLKEMSPEERKIINKGIESLVLLSGEKEGKDIMSKSGHSAKQIKIMPELREMIKDPAVLRELGLMRTRVKTEETEIQRRQRIWISKNLEPFEGLGLIEVERGRQNCAKRTWAGDLISDVIEEKYNRIMHKLKS